MKNDNAEAQINNKNSNKNWNGTRRVSSFW